MRSRKPLLCLLAVSALLASHAFAQSEDQGTLPAPKSTTLAAPSYASDPAFQKALAATREPNLSPADRLVRWTAANDAANKKCVECLRNIITADFNLRSSSDAATAAIQLDAIASERNDLIYAETSAARALAFPSSTAASQGQLNQAERYAHAALALAPNSAYLLFLQGRILATLGRDDEARSTFTHFLEVANETNRDREKARQYAVDPHLAIIGAPPGSSTEHGIPVTGTSASQSAPASDATPKPAFEDDPKFIKAVATARDRHQPSDERFAQWKKASKIAKGECIYCLRQVLAGQMDQAQWKDAIATATQMDAIAPDKKDKAFAEEARGVCLMHSNGDNPKPDQLKQAEASISASLVLVPYRKNALYAEGRVLAMLGRNDDAKAIFQDYLDVAKESDHYRLRVEHFIENPHLAALQMAPPFTVTTSEGEQITLDDMNGKIVLLDFWATWCGPCKETLPEIASIAKDFAGQPLVVVSISIDQDEMAWKAFVAKNSMTWPQFHDRNGALSSAYGVSTIPRFFTIDVDGVLQSVKVGSGADVRGDIRRLLAKVRDTEKKRIKATDKAAAGQ